MDEHQINNFLDQKWDPKGDEIVQECISRYSNDTSKDDTDKYTAIVYLYQLALEKVIPGLDRWAQISAVQGTAPLLAEQAKEAAETTEGRLALLLMGNIFTLILGTRMPE